MYDLTISGADHRHDGELHGCPCGADALAQLLAVSGIDLAVQVRALAGDPARCRRAEVDAPALFTHARILTFGDVGTEGEAMLVRDGRIAWVGNADEVEGRCVYRAAQPG